MKYLYTLAALLLVASTTYATLPPITGNNGVCLSGTTALANATPGGLWSCVSIFATVDAATGVVTGTAPGTATISYTVGSDVATTTVTVHPAIQNMTPLTVCAGSTGFLNPVAAGGTWSSSNTTVGTVGTAAVTNFYGLSAGTSTLTYTLSAGCYATRQVSVSATPADIAGIPSLCQGATTSLTCSTSGGAWSSSQPLVASVDAATGLVTGAGGGQSTIRYILPNGCSKTTIVTVAATTATITGGTTICSGGFSTLAYIATGGTWTSASTTIATVNPTTGHVSGISAGTTVITYTHPSCSSPFTTVVSVNSSVPATTGTTSICNGSFAQLSNVMPGGTWSSSTPSVATVGTGFPNTNVSGVSAGTATISYSVPGCGNTTTIVTVQPAIPNIGGVPYCAGGTFTLTNSLAGGTWSSSNTAVATVGSSTGIVTTYSTPSTTGSAAITYTMPYGCIRTAVLSVPPPSSEFAGCNNVGVGDTVYYGSGYYWYSTNPSIVQVDNAGRAWGVTPGVATVVLVPATDICVNYSKVVTVTPTSLIKQMTGSNVLCPGMSTPLTAPLGGGTWSCTSTSIATVTSTGTVTGVANGAALITYSLAPYECTRAMYVNPVPGPAIAPATICTGETKFITASTGDYGFGMANTFIGQLNVWFGNLDAPLPVPFGYTSSDTNVVKIVASGVGNVYGNGAGSANVNIYAPNTGCTTVVPVTVSATTTAPITGSRNVCIAGTTTLASTTTGGTWTSSNASIATVNSSGVVTGLASGTAVITYDAGSTCGKVYAVVTVNAMPAAITGVSTPKCLGTSFTAGQTLPGGSWTSSDPAVATINAATGLVNCLTTGSTIITYTAASCGNFVTATVNVVSSFNITGVNNICNGATTTFFAGSGGTWTSSNTAVAVVGTVGTITSLSAGTATISFTSPGCTVSTRSLTVYPFAPITGSSIACINTPLPLSSEAPGGLWTSSNPSRAVVDENGIVTPVLTGNITITYSMPSGCRSTKAINIAVVPIAYALTGGGTYCTGSAAPVLNMTGITGSTTYQLYRNGVPVGSPISTTSFGPQAISGVYSAIGTNTSGCSTAMIGTPTVTATSSVTSITGVTAACLGGGILLSNSMTGGTWSSTNTSAATVTSTGVVVPVNPGTTTIRYTTTCGVATHVMTINAAMPSITGGTQVCQGSSITLAIAATGGTWSSSGAGTIDAISGVLTGVSAGGATVLYTGANGCVKSTSVAVNVIPIITAPTALCVGSTATVTATGGTGGTWTSSNLSVGTTGAGSVTGTGIGTAALSYTSPGGCTGSRIFNVTAGCAGAPVAGSAMATPSVICYGGSSTLSLIGHALACGNTMQWQVSTDGTTWTDISGATNEQYTASASTSTWYRCGINCSSTTTYSIPTYVTTRNSIIGYSILQGATTLSCENAHFKVNACANNAASVIKTYFGDGTNSLSGLVTAGGTNSAHVYHSYSIPGTYTIKHVMLDNGMPVDSIVYTYNHLYCNTLYVGIYNDFNSDCIYNGTDALNAHPVAVAIDSNGIPLDTINVTSGLLLNTYGPAGTVYGFRLANVSDGRTPACPISGVMYDTITGAAGSYPAKYLGLRCSASTDFDLSTYVSLSTLTTQAVAHIYVTNTHCTPQDPVMTVNFSPKYQFANAYPAPASVSGNTITWNLPTVSAAGTATRHITLWMDPSYPLSLWDTVQSDYMATPTSGDINTTNNYVFNTSVVRGSYDPNDISVFPEGKVLPCDKLTYTVRFENMGNDTARNVYVLDTLPAGIDASSLNVVMASANMNVAVINDGVRNIARFEFPGINLLDSSYHGQNTGMFIFTVNAKNGLADGVALNNRVSIYFDDNAPVLTNTASNVIGIEATAGPDEVCLGASVTLSNASAGGTWSAISGASVTAGVVTAIAAGVATVSYTVSNQCVSRSAVHLLTVNTIPSSYAITGETSVCLGNTSQLSHTLTGGNWTSDNAAVASVSSTGLVTAHLGGSATISYSVTNSCGTATASTVVTVSMVTPVPILSGPAVACIGSTYTVTATAPGGAWHSSNNAIGTISNAGILTGLTDGTVLISYTTSSGCATHVATISATVSSLPSAGAIVGASPVCVGNSLLLSTTATGGVWSSANSSIVSVSGTGVATAIAEGTAQISYSVVNSCGSDVATTTVTANPLPAAGTITGTTSLCASASGTVSSSAGGGAWSSDNVTVATVSSTGTISAYAAGVAAISYSVTNSCGTDVATRLLTVNALPDAGSLTMTTAICEASTTAATSTGATGLWTTSNAAVASISTSGIISGLSAGTAVVSYTVTNVCGTDRATQPITINALPDAGMITGPSHLCQGSSTVLATTGDAGTWTTGSSAIASVSSVGAVTGVATGVTTVSYTVTNLCGTDVSSISLNVDPLPDAGTISGAATVCAGAATTITSSVPGGTWAVSDAAVAAISGAGIATGLVSGTTNVSYTVTNSCGTDLRVHTLSVNPLPEAGTLSGPSSVCVGSTITLTSTVAGGNWASSATTSASVSSTGIVTGVAMGPAMISYIVVNGCGSDVSTITIAVKPQPDAGSIVVPAKICEGSSSILTSTAAGGEWVSDNTAIASVTASGVLHGLAPGAALISYRVTNSCGTDLRTHSVTIEKTMVPVVAISASPGLNIGQGEELTLTANAINVSPMHVYQWFRNGVPIQGATSDTYVSSRFTDNDSISCMISPAGDECMYPGTNSIVVHVGNTVSSPAQTSDLVLFPNPNQGTLILRGGIPGASQPYSVVIFDALGQEVQKLEANQVGGTLTTQIELNKTLANGAYLVKITGNGENRTIRFTLQR